MKEQNIDEKILESIDIVGFTLPQLEKARKTEEQKKDEEKSDE